MKRITKILLIFLLHMEQFQTGMFASGQQSLSRALALLESQMLSDWTALLPQSSCCKGQRTVVVVTVLLLDHKRSVVLSGILDPLHHVLHCSGLLIIIIYSSFASSVQMWNIAGAVQSKADRRGQIFILVRSTGVDTLGELEFNFN